MAVWGLMSLRTRHHQSPICSLQAKLAIKHNRDEQEGHQVAFRVDRTYLYDKSKGLCFVPCRCAR